MKITVPFKGQLKVIDAEWIRGQLWYHLDGETRIWEPAAARRGAGKVKKDQIISPMPGKVTKVLRKVGDEIQAGDVILVLEAMKMEYSMKSDIAGTIESISVQTDEQTVLGKVLVKIKPANKEEA